MSLYVRQLSIRDLDQSDDVESSAFSPETAASREKIEYRLTVCPEVCMGLFSRKGTEMPVRVDGDIPFIDEPPFGANQDTLLAHILSTRSNTSIVRDEDMECPKQWRTDPHSEPGVGHIPGGRTIAMHALAVAPAHQKSGLGKALTKVYIERFRNTGTTDKIAILTYDSLVSYYEKLGFTHYGKSEAQYAGIEWHDLAYEYKS